MFPASKKNFFSLKKENGKKIQNLRNWKRQLLKFNYKKYQKQLTLQNGRKTCLGVQPTYLQASLKQVKETF